MNWISMWHHEASCTNKCFKSNSLHFNTNTSSYFSTFPRAWSSHTLSYMSSLVLSKRLLYQVDFLFLFLGRIQISVDFLNEKN